MKKKNQKSKKKGASKKPQATKSKAPVKTEKTTANEKQVVRSSSRSLQKKGSEKKKDSDVSSAKIFKKAVQFLRDARMELKKVKWPTRKELLASTAVVIVLTLFVAFYLGLVDFGLIKIIKTIVG